MTAQPVFIIDPTINPIPIVPQGTPIGRGTLKCISSARATGMSAAGRAYVVPAAKIWQLQAVYFQMTATATAGNRFIVCAVSNGSFYQWIGPQSAAVAATKVVGYIISFGAGVDNTTVRSTAALTTATTDVQVNTQCPVLYLPATGSVLLDDVANIDIADAINEYQLWVVEYDV